MDATTPATQIPPAAAWLGGLGLLPFVGLAAVVAIDSLELAGTAQPVLLAYGAIILSFLGGAQWGFTLKSAAGDARTRKFVGVLLLSVIPALLGWVALLLPYTAGVWLLVASFIGVMQIDLAQVKAGSTPSWYARLRLPLSFIVVASLCLTLMR